MEEEVDGVIVVGVADADEAIVEGRASQDEAYALRWIRVRVRVSA